MEESQVKGVEGEDVADVENYFKVMDDIWSAGAVRRSSDSFAIEVRSTGCCGMFTQITEERLEASFWILLILGKSLFCKLL